MESIPMSAPQDVNPLNFKGRNASFLAEFANFMAGPRFTESQFEHFTQEKVMDTAQIVGKISYQLSKPLDYRGRNQVFLVEFANFMAGPRFTEIQFEQVTQEKVVDTAPKVGKIRYQLSKPLDYRGRNTVFLANFASFMTGRRFTESQFKLEEAKAKDETVNHEHQEMSSFFSKVTDFLSQRLFPLFGSQSK